MLKFDANSEKALRFLEALKEELDLSLLPEDLCLVIGGDGFLLRVIAEEGPNHTYLGINSGTLGFMLNDVEDFSKSMDQIRSGSWKVFRVPRLAMEATTGTGDVFSALALNDVTLQRMSGQTTHLRVWVDGVRAVDRMVCDGLIVSTALGSTAYSFSAGGPACHPNLRLMQLTAICPHMPRLPPITLPLDSVVEVEVLDSTKRPARVATDGIDHPEAVRLRVAHAEADVRLAFLDQHNATATLIRKVIST